LFQNETVMIPPLVAAATRRWTRDGNPWVVLREHQSDSRISDVVLAHLELDALRSRLNVGCARPLSRPQLVVLRAVRCDCGTSARALASRLRGQEKTVQKTLHSLEQLGYLERHVSGSYRRRLGLRPIASRFISIEAKRSDWRAALAQAAAHTRFANESYVAFDAAYSTRFRKAQRHFEAMGIGLLALDADTGELVQVTAARAHLRTNPLSVAMACEQMLATLHNPTRLPQTTLPNVSAQFEGRATARPVGGCRRTLLRLLPFAAQPSSA